MENLYSVLGVKKEASDRDIKKAFRDRAKQLHPDLAGKHAEREMQKLLAAYEVLSNARRRFEYDRAYERFIGCSGFDYRVFLRSRPDDPASQAKLIFFQLLHFECEDALDVWRKNGGLGFPLEKYLDREDWMDCCFLLAEELVRSTEQGGTGGPVYEAVMLLTRILGEERRLPYFRHFAEDVEGFLKELVRQKLKAAVDTDCYIECLEAVLGLGFPPREESRILRSLAQALLERGENGNAEAVFREALKRDPSLPNAGGLRRRFRAVL